MRLKACTKLHFLKKSKHQKELVKNSPPKNFLGGEFRRKIKMEVTERLDKLLKERNLSIPQLTKKAGLSPKAIYNWYRGSSPRIKALQQICTALNITLEDFFKEENRIEICKQEKELILSYRKLSENAKRDLVQCAEILRR